MAATKRNAMRHEEARTKIQTTQLINRLSNHVFGTVELSPSQVTAGLGLLKKTLPDLTQAQLTGPNGGPIQYVPVATGIGREPGDDRAG